MKPLPPSCLVCICFQASALSSFKPASLRILFNSFNWSSNCFVVALKSFIISNF
nr:MAG TPA: hypothetical protein [Caudoviricetes sp.]